ITAIPINNSRRYGQQTTAAGSGERSMQPLMHDQPQPDLTGAIAPAAWRYSPQSAAPRPWCAAWLLSDGWAHPRKGGGKLLAVGLAHNRGGGSRGLISR